MPSFIRLSILLLALVSLTTSRAEDQTWPGVPFGYVKGYFYYPENNSDQSILQNGRLHASIEKMVALTKDDVTRLRATALIPPPPEGRARAMMSMCYWPHHAFIFFDALTRKPVAHVEICFLCKHATATPPLPDDHVWNLPALQALCTKLGLPLANDPEFKALSDLPNGEHEAHEKKFAPHLPALEAAGKARISPPREHAWPWLPYRKVKICLFNAAGWQPHLVNLGKLDSSIAQMVELTPEQQDEVWLAFTAAKETHQISAEARIMLDYDGARVLYFQGFPPIRNPPNDPKTIRRGLICFDEEDRPLAWLAFSEKDGARLMQPADTATPVSNQSLWDPFKLGKVFDKLGLPVPPGTANPEK